MRAARLLSVVRLYCLRPCARPRIIIIYQYPCRASRRSKIAIANVLLFGPRTTPRRRNTRGFFFVLFRNKADSNVVRAHDALCARRAPMFSRTPTCISFSATMKSRDRRREKPDDFCNRPLVSRKSFRLYWLPEQRASNGINSVDVRTLFSVGR